MKKKYESFDVRGLAPHVKLVTGGCWEWLGPRDKDGYGVVRNVPGGHLVHRLSYAASIGPCDGVMVLHSCDNRRCCNPLHLFLGDHTMNMEDMRRKGRRDLRISVSMVPVLKAYVAAGATVRQLSDMFGVSDGSIRYRLGMVRRRQ